MSNDTNASNPTTTDAMPGQPVKVSNIQVRTLLLPPPQVVLEAKEGLYQPTTYPNSLRVLQPWKEIGPLKKDQEYIVTFSDKGNEVTKNMLFEGKTPEGQLLFLGLPLSAE